MYGKDVWVEIVEFEGDSFKVKSEFFEPKFLMSKSGPAKVVFLIKTLLEEQCAPIDSFMRKAIYKRFHTTNDILFLREIEEVE